ncbi:MAG: hypothetical protein ACK5LT_00610 [Lachnospirales bacterium]
MRYLIIFLIGLLLSGCTSTAEKIATLEKERDVLKTEVKKLESEISNLNSKFFEEDDVKVELIRTFYDENVDTLFIRFSIDNNLDTKINKVLGDYYFYNTEGYFLKVFSGQVPMELNPNEKDVEYVLEVNIDPTDVMDVYFTEQQDLILDFVPTAIYHEGKE